MADPRTSPTRCPVIISGARCRNRAAERAQAGAPALAVPRCRNPGEPSTTAALQESRRAVGGRCHRQVPPARRLPRCTRAHPSVLAQRWSMRYVLVDGQGNFRPRWGTAMRRRPCATPRSRMDRLGPRELLADIEQGDGRLSGRTTTTSAPRKPLVAPGAVFPQPPGQTAPTGHRRWAMAHQTSRPTTCGRWWNATMPPGWTQAQGPRWADLMKFVPGPGLPHRGVHHPGRGRHPARRTRRGRGQDS